MFYLHGETEPIGVELVSQPGGLSDYSVQQYRKAHEAAHRQVARPVTLLNFGVDHGLGAHAGNGDKWRTTVVALVRLDYLKGKPTSYIRLEKDRATELMAELADAIAIRERGNNDDD